MNALAPSFLSLVNEARARFIQRHGWGLFLTLLWSIGGSVIVYYGWLQKPMMNYGDSVPFKLVGEAGPDGLVIVRMGDIIAFETMRCNLSGDELDYTTSREIVPVDQPDSKPARLETGSSTLFQKTGCEPSKSARIRAPEVGLKPGIHYLHGTAKVPGTWRTASVPWRTQNFRLLPSLKGNAP